MKPEEKNKEGRRDYSGFSLDERTNVSNRLVNFIPHLKDKFIVQGIVDEKLSAKDAEVQIFMDEKALREIKTRQGQPEFRRALMAVYESTCQITGSKVEWVLEAAHIVPHAEETNYSIHNGFLLRSDIHTLFDLGVIQIKPSGKKLMVSVDDDLLSSEYGQYHEKELDIIPSDEMLKNISDRNKKYFNS
jgi:predicted restriction endonuclease